MSLSGEITEETSFSREDGGSAVVVQRRASARTRNEGTAANDNSLDAYYAMQRELGGPFGLIINGRPLTANCARSTAKAHRNVATMLRSRVIGLRLLPNAISQGCTNSRG